MEKIAEVLQQQFAAQQQKFEELQQRNEEQMKLMRDLFQSELSAGASSPSTSNSGAATMLLMLLFLIFFSPLACHNVYRFFASSLFSCCPIIRYVIHA